MASVNQIPDDVSFGQEDTFGFGVDLRYSIGSLTPKSVWDKKEPLQEYAKTSKEFWDTLEAEKQEATVRIIRSALERMYDHAEEWIPEAIDTTGLEANAGDYFDFNIRLIFTDVDREFNRHYRASSFQIAQAAKEAERLANGLDVDDDTDAESV